jgi:hypothetical protein
VAVKTGSQVTAALYLGLTFMAGAALGVSGTYYYVKTPVTAASTRQNNSEALRKAYLGEMRDRLHLSPEQEKHLTEILDSTRELFRQVQDKHRPEFRAIQEHQTDLIRALLDPKQQAEYEVVRTERQERAKNMERDR